MLHGQLSGNIHIQSFKLLSKQHRLSVSLQFAGFPGHGLLLSYRVHHSFLVYCQRAVSAGVVWSSSRRLVNEQVHRYRNVIVMRQTCYLYHRRTPPIPSVTAPIIDECSILPAMVAVELIILTAPFITTYKKNGERHAGDMGSLRKHVLPSRANYGF